MCAGHEVIIQVIVLHDFNLHCKWSFAILQDPQSGFARLSHHAVYKPLLQGVATMSTKEGFSGNYIPNSAKFSRVYIFTDNNFEDFVEIIRELAARAHRTLRVKNFR